MGLSGIVGRLRYITSPVLPLIWVPLLYQVLSALGLILAIWESADRALDEQEKLPWKDETFDFIVVGAGSAGSVVANRLSKHFSVLLLEAGGEPNPLQLIPGFGVFLINHKELDWQHKTVAQKYSTLNSVNQQSSWSAGRGLGGSGNLNLMIHLRGHTSDFDNWARITGDSSWSWDGVLPHFKSYEDYDEGGDSKYHGFGGSLRVGEPDYVGLGPEFVKAGEELGYPKSDLNAPFSEAFDILKFPIKHGLREAPYRAFIQPIRRRKTLTIRKFSLVTRILFKEGNVAYGVEYDRHGERRVAYASKEVIISAGAITSPKILLLSGLGPAEHLHELGIPVRQNLPVGLNLQDHTAVYLGPFFINKPKTVALERDLTPGAFVQWFTGGRGILSSPGAHAAGAISSSYAKARGEGNWPDLVLYYFGFSVFKTFGATFARAFNLKYDEQVNYFKHAVGKETFMLVISGARPLSRGYLKLGGKSPYDDLIIDPNYLNDPGDVDLKVLIEGVKASIYLIENTTSFGENLGGRFTEECLPGCEHVPFRSDAYWECYIRRYTVTLHHPVGSCGMGQVVDTRLRVIGTRNLRVIDASVQPVIVVTNTQASSLMIGEKGAHTILEDYKYIQNQKANEIYENQGGYSENIPQFAFKKPVVNASSSQIENNVSKQPFNWYNFEFSKK